MGWDSTTLSYPAHSCYDVLNLHLSVCSIYSLFSLCKSIHYNARLHAKKLDNFLERGNPLPRPHPLGAYSTSIFAPSALMLIISPSKPENLIPPMLGGGKLRQLRGGEKAPPCPPLLRAWPRKIAKWTTYIYIQIYVDDDGKIRSKVAGKKVMPSWHHGMGYMTLPGPSVPGPVKLAECSPRTRRTRNWRSRKCRDTHEIHLASSAVYVFYGDEMHWKQMEKEKTEK